MYTLHISRLKLTIQTDFICYHPSLSLYQIFQSLNVNKPQIRIQTYHTQLTNVLQTSNHHPRMTSTSASSSTCWFDSIALQSCIGFGSFGLVFKALQHPLDSPAAVKIIFLDEYDDKDEEDRILREYELLKDKSHVNIVAALNLIEKSFNSSELASIFTKMVTNSEEKHTLMMKAYYTERAQKYGHIRAFCLKMQLCGETLREWLKYHTEDINCDHRQRLVWDKTFLTQQCSITQGLLDGLQFLHRHKIIHRDFKPDNVMFSGSGYTLPVKIGDFGLCRQIHSENSCTGVLTTNRGTLAYMAPEMNSEGYAEPVDLFALGLVLLEVLQLVKQSERNKLFDAIVNDNQTSLIQEHHLISNAKHVITHLTKKKAADRFSSVEDIFITVSDYLNVTSDTDLSKCLEHCADGDHILLHSGVYNGTFKLRRNNVLIKGVESGNVLLRNKTQQYRGRGRGVVVLQIIGNFCTIRNISIGSPNVQWALLVHGDSNTISNVECGNCQNAIKLMGNNNSISHVTINSATINGVSIHGHENNVANLTCTSGFSGININGNKNRLSSILVIAIANSSRDMGYSGIRHSRGSYNQVDGLICRISKRPFSEWAFSCFRADAICATIKNVECHYILLNGAGHTLENVKCKKLLRVYGFGHTLQRVSGDRLEIREQEASLDKCKFKKKIASKNFPQRLESVVDDAHGRCKCIGMGFGLAWLWGRVDLLRCCKCPSCPHR